MTLQQFLDWEVLQELRWEFDGVRATAMNGGTITHEAIGNTLRALLQQRLRGSECKVSGPGLKVATSEGIRYPDALIMCGPIEPRATIAVNPVALFEVLSPSTGGTDRIVKLREYQRIPSVMHYVILEQGRVGAIVLSRTPTDHWEAVALAQGDVLALTTPAVTIPLDAVYRDVDFSDIDLSDAEAAE